MDKAQEPVSDGLLDLTISAKSWTAYDMEAESQKQGGSKANGGKRSDNEHDGNDKVVQDVDLVVLPELSVESCRSESPRLTVQEGMAADREKRVQAAETRRASQLPIRALRMAKSKGKD
ncbi:hypothetical protein BG015_009679 [Linnemannia schmuckeri]|uniref:Uncharacterized protein n=1 Tax=Linnemannia schmuckeri TaxID=64567 RepID=A0A9P5VEU4_9FUNG|nr:hypothetical protein BG015_009679 [Linnemannia schmuckeri]